MSVMWGNSRHKQNIEPFPKSAYLQVFDHWWCLAHFGWQNFAGAKGFADQNMLDHTSQPRARWKWKFSRRKGASFFPVFSVIIFGSGPGPLFCMLVSVLGRIGQRDPRILGAAPCGPWRRVSVGITWGCNNICWHSISSASPHAGTSSPKKKWNEKNNNNLGISVSRYHFRKLLADNWNSISSIHQYPESSTW